MKSWWPGDLRVEKFMGPVSEAIDRHVPKGDARTDIYNRAYEAVYAAIKEQEVNVNLKVLAPKKSDEQFKY